MPHAIGYREEAWNEMRIAVQGDAALREAIEALERIADEGKNCCYVHQQHRRTQIYLALCKLARSKDGT